MKKFIIGLSVNSDWTARSCIVHNFGGLFSMQKQAAKDAGNPVNFCGNLLTQTKTSGSVLRRNIDTLRGYDGESHR